MINNLETVVKAAGGLAIFKEPFLAVKKYKEAADTIIYAVKYDDGLRILTGNGIANYEFDNGCAYSGEEAELKKIVESGDYLEFVDECWEEIDIEATVRKLAKAIPELL